MASATSYGKGSLKKLSHYDYLGSFALEKWVPLSEDIIFAYSGCSEEKGPCKQQSGEGPKVQESMMDEALQPVVCLVSNTSFSNDE